MWGLGYFAYQIILVRTASVLMLTMNLILGTTTMAFMAFVVWRSSAMVPSMVVLYEQGQEAMVRMASVVQQALTGIRIVKGFSGQVLESEKFDAAAKLAQLHDTKCEPYCSPEKRRIVEQGTHDQLVAHKGLY
jgi:ABC-type multidrug transport system fused ATPase/permease subunit